MPIQRNSKQKLPIITSIFLVLALTWSSLIPAAVFSQDEADKAKEITVITPNGDELDFIATPEQLQSVLTRIINQVLGPTGAAPSEAEAGAIQENIQEAVNATFAASKTIESSVATPSGIFGLPIPIEACAEVLGARFCL
jgi:hypothetical protein